MTITAIDRLITRPWPATPRLTRPEAQIRSTHAATCPVCGTEVRIRIADTNADTFNVCQHFEAIEQRGAYIAVRFTA